MKTTPKKHGRPPLPKDKQRINVNIRLPKELVDRLHHLSRVNNDSVTSLIEDAIRCLYTRIA